MGFGREPDWSKVNVVPPRQPARDPETWWGNALSWIVSAIVLVLMVVVFGWLRMNVPIPFAGP